MCNISMLNLFLDARKSFEISAIALYVIAQILNVNKIHIQ